MGQQLETKPLADMKLSRSGRLIGIPFPFGAKPANFSGALGSIMSETVDG